MNQIRSILEDTYQLSESRDSTDSDLYWSRRKMWVNSYHRKSGISLEAFLTVLITSLVKKIETPAQDVRYHQDRTSKWLFRKRLRHRSYNTLHEREI